MLPVLLPGTQKATKQWASVREQLAGLIRAELTVADPARGTERDS